MSSELLLKSQTMLPHHAGDKKAIDLKMITEANSCKQKPKPPLLRFHTVSVGCTPDPAPKDVSSCSRSVAVPNSSAVANTGLDKIKRSQTLAASASCSGAYSSALALRSVFQKRKNLKKHLTMFPIQQRKGRLTSKNGGYCVKETNIPQQKLQFLKDMYTTLIEASWYYTCLLFIAGYSICYVLFTIGYLIASQANDDFNPSRNDSSKNCIVNGNDFSSLFLFSFETQHTIGYGFRYISKNCPGAVVLSILQVWAGTVLQSFLVAIVISKLINPRQRAKTLIFSKYAVVTLRDGQLCFMIRVGDMRKTHLIDARVRLLLIRSYETRENEFLPFHQFDLSLGFQRHEQDNLFLAWPTILCHIIDSKSPLFHYSREDMELQDFEIIAILEGTVESTGQATQARTSYRPKEILWGHRFETLLTYQSNNGEYIVNYARFHETYAVETPTCSAKDLEQGIEDNEEEDKDPTDNAMTVRSCDAF